MTWWQTVPAFVLTTAIVFLPGYLVLRCWAATGLVAVAVAAPVSIGILSAAAIVAPWAGVDFGVLILVVPALVLAAVGLVVRRARPRAVGIEGRVRRSPRSRWTLLAHLGALVIPFTLISGNLAKMIGSPENISQTYDNVFHLNAIRYILDTGSGSSLTLGGMYTDGERVSSYPAAWHDLVALVAQLSGQSIPVAVNIVTVVIGALIWPVAAIFLVTRVTGTRPVPVLFAGALSSVFGAFPYLMAEFGILYPFYLSLAVLPVGIGLIAMITGVGERNGTPRWLAGLALVAVTPAIALSHPSTFLVLLLFAVPIFIVAVVRYRRVLAGRRGAGRYWLLVATLVVYLLVGVAVWIRVRPSVEASGWATVQSIPQAIGEVLAGGLMGQGPSWIALALTVVAAGLAMRRRFSQWVLGVYAIAAFLFIVVSSLDYPGVRLFVTGVWYNDPNRLAAQIPIIAVVVCSISATWLFLRTRDVLTERYPRLAGLKFTRESTPAAAAVAFAVALVMAVVGQYGSVNYAVAAGRPDYQPQPAEEAPLLSPDERALIERLDQHIPEGQKIIGYAWTGTAFAYALGGRRTLTPHLAESSVPADVTELMNDLDLIDTDPRVCELVDRYDAYYVLDFPGRVLWENDTFYPGLATIAANPDAVEVDRQGEAALYRLTGCGGPSAPGR